MFPKHVSHSVVGQGLICMNYSNVTWSGYITLLKAQVALIVTFSSSASVDLLSPIFLFTIPSRFSAGFRSSGFAVQGLKPSIATYGSAVEPKFALDFKQLGFVSQSSQGCYLRRPRVFLRPDFFLPFNLKLMWVTHSFFSSDLLYGASWSATFPAIASPTGP